MDRHKRPVQSLVDLISLLKPSALLRAFYHRLPAPYLLKSGFLILALSFSHYLMAKKDWRWSRLLHTSSAMAYLAGENMVHQVNVP